MAESLIDTNIIVYSKTVGGLVEIGTCLCRPLYHTFNFHSHYHSTCVPSSFINYKPYVIPGIDSWVE